MASRGYFGSPETGQIDFSPLGELPEVWAKGRERAREEQFRQALAGWGGTDYNDLVRRAAQAGSLEGLKTTGQLALTDMQRRIAAAAQGETARHNKAVEAQIMKPVIHWDAPNAFDPSAPATGMAVITNKDGTTRYERISVPREQAPQTQPETGGDLFGGTQGALPTGRPPSTPGPQSALPVPQTVAQAGPPEAPQMPPGAMAQLQPPPGQASPSQAMLEQAQLGVQGGQPPRGPQYAAAPGATATDAGPGPAPQPTWMTGAQMPAPPPGATLEPPPAPRPPVVPEWLGAAQARPETRTPRTPEPALGPEQRGELKYTQPLGPFNDGAIEVLPKQAQNTIKGLASGRINLASIPQKDRAAYMNKVFEYYPGWDQGLYSKRTQTMNAFAKGVEGRTLTAISNLTEHLDTAQELMTAMKNKERPPVINALVNKWREVSGYEAELPGNVKAAAPIIAGEMLKVIAGAGAGGVMERAEAALHTMSTSATPAAAAGALHTIKQLMIGQIKGLHLRYEGNTYNTDFRQKLLPGARKLFDQSEHVSGAGGAGGASGAGTLDNVPYRIIP